MLKLNTEYIQSEVFKNMSPKSLLDYKDIMIIFNLNTPGNIGRYIEKGYLPLPDSINFGTRFFNGGSSGQSIRKRKWSKTTILNFIKKRYNI
jgi:hypothetical protein